MPAEGQPGTVRGQAESDHAGATHFGVVVDGCVEAGQVEPVVDAVVGGDGTNAPVGLAMATEAGPTARSVSSSRSPSSQIPRTMVAVPGRWVGDEAGRSGLGWTRTPAVAASANTVAPIAVAVT